MRPRVLTALAAAAVACAAPTAAAQDADEALCNTPSPPVECQVATHGDTSSEPAAPRTETTPCTPKVSADRPVVEFGEVTLEVGLSCVLDGELTATVRPSGEAGSSRVAREGMRSSYGPSGELDRMTATVRLRVPDAVRAVTVTVTNASGATVGQVLTVPLPRVRCDADYKVSLRSHSRTRATVRVTVTRCKGVRYTVRTATGASTTQGFGGLTAEHNPRRASTRRARQHGVKQTLLITTRLSRGDDTIRVVVADGKGRRLNPGTLVYLDA